jgi:hypothetical protein
VVSVKDPAAAATGIQLHPANPNPFTSKAQISYELPAAAHVRISVYDLTGREVALLAQGMRPAGISSIEIDAAGLQPGMYFCRMRTGTEIRTQSLMLLR